MRSQDLTPNQRTILITGCSSGIGRHCALALQQKGYQVFATARQAKDVEALSQQGLNASLLDLTSTDSIKSALEHILKQTDNQLFALFNNAGFGQPGAVEDLSRDMLRAQFETNVFGTLELTNLVLPVMRKQGYGRIIQNSSVLGLISLPFRGAYNASKHALEALTDTLRLELISSPIKISTIEPGPITSHFRRNAYAMFLKNIQQDQSPFKHIYRALESRLQDDKTDPPFTLGPEAVEAALLHALHAKQPKAHYYVTFPTYLFGFLRRCLSTNLLDKVLLRAAGNEAKLLKNAFTE
jgi:NAD(P)-dependent dehydrogenase (short-subunit alcohol dehydrogenase family)